MNSARITRCRESLSFLRTLGLIYVSYLGPLLLFLAAGYYGLLGYLTVAILLTGPMVYVLRKRELQAPYELDDKLGWKSMQEAIDRYIKDVKEAKAENE